MEMILHRALVLCYVRGRCSINSDYCSAWEMSYSGPQSDFLFKDSSPCLLFLPAASDYVEEV